MVVVGLPLSLDGRSARPPRLPSPRRRRWLPWSAVPVETFDERLTTVTADRALMEAKMRAQARRRVVDKVAAAVMLQAWLDRRAAPTSCRPAGAGRYPGTVSRTDRPSTDWRRDPWDEPEDVEPEDMEPLPPERKGGRRLGLAFLAILVVLAVLAGLAGRWAIQQVHPPGEPG